MSAQNPYYRIVLHSEVWYLQERSRLDPNAYVDVLDRTDREELVKRMNRRYENYTTHYVSLEATIIDYINAANWYMVVEVANKLKDLHDKLVGLRSLRMPEDAAV